MNGSNLVYICILVFNRIKQTIVYKIYILMLLYNTEVQYYYRIFNTCFVSSYRESAYLLILLPIEKVF